MKLTLDVFKCDVVQVSMVSVISMVLVMLL